MASNLRRELRDSSLPAQGSSRSSCVMPEREPCYGFFTRAMIYRVRAFRINVNVWLGDISGKFRW